MNYSEEKKRGNGLLITIIVVLLLIIAFFGGFFVKGMMSEEKKDNKEEAKEEKQEEKKSNVPVTDTYAFGRSHLMFINDGDLYSYSVINERLTDLYPYTVYNITHSGCYYDNSRDYCVLNKEYSYRATKVDGLPKVKRIKLYNMPAATDESFSFFAITEVGDVYSIDDYKNTKPNLFLENKDVEDMLGSTPNSIEILLKNGKHMIYSWEPEEGTDGFKFNYVEKK